MKTRSRNLQLEFRNFLVLNFSYLVFLTILSIFFYRTLSFASGSVAVSAAVSAEASNSDLAGEVVLAPTLLEPGEYLIEINIPSCIQAIAGIEFFEKFGNSSSVKNLVLKPIPTKSNRTQPPPPVCFSNASIKAIQYLNVETDRFIEVRSTFINKLGSRNTEVQIKKINLCF